MNIHTLQRLAVLADRADDLAWREAAELIRRAGDYRWVGLYDVTDEEIRAVAWTGSVAPAFPWFPRERGLNGAAVTSRQAVVCQDVSSDTRYLTAFDDTGSEAIFPVLSEAGEVIGTIDVECDHRDAFSAEDERFLHACATTLRKLWRRQQRPKHR